MANDKSWSETRQESPLLGPDALHAHIPLCEYVSICCTDCLLLCEDSLVSGSYAWVSICCTDCLLLCVDSLASRSYAWVSIYCTDCVLLCVDSLASRSYAWVSIYCTDCVLLCEDSLVSGSELESPLLLCVGLLTEVWQQDLCRPFSKEFGTTTCFYN